MRTVRVILALLFALVLGSSYIMGAKAAPQGLVYLGVVHHPQDYFYYLSQFTQGKTRLFTSIDLYSHDAANPTLVGVTNVFMGHMFSLIGVSPILAYQLSLLLFTFVFLYYSLVFLKMIFPKEKQAQIIAFLLFCFANAFPTVTNTNGQFIIDPMQTFFINVMEPMVRFSRVPHQMLGLICTIAPIIIIIQLQSNTLSSIQKYIRYAILAVCGTLLANINPVQWLLVVLVLGLSLLWNSFIHRKHASLFKPLVPVVIFFFTGLPMTVYLMRLFNSPPFSQLAVWESWQLVTLNIWGFIMSFGPVTLLAIAGLPLFLRKMTLARIIIVFYLLTSIALFVSPLAEHAHITNVRFLSALTALGICIIAADFITHLPIRKSAVHRIVSWSIVGIGMLIFVPFFASQYQREANVNPSNSYLYIGQSAYDAFKEAQKRTTMEDVVLVTWPYDASFPAITGRRGYMGHPLLTINSDAKIQQADYFFEAKEDDNAMHKFLRDNGITYVLSFASVAAVQKPFMLPVYKNDLMVLYKVLP